MVRRKISPELVNQLFMACVVLSTPEFYREYVKGGESKVPALNAFRDF